MPLQAADAPFTSLLALLPRTVDGQPEAGARALRSGCVPARVHCAADACRRACPGVSAARRAARRGVRAWRAVRVAW
eukprot:6753991-Prymnesium_polylepis.1